MDTLIKRYEEYLPEKISVKRKVTAKTEKRNFHLHKQLEIVFALSDNLKVKFEDRVIPLPANSLLFLDSMNLHYNFSEEGSGNCDRYVLYFSSEYISSFSTPEINLLECFLLPKEEPCVLLNAQNEDLEDLFFLLNRMQKQFSNLENGCEDFGTTLHLKLLLSQFLLFSNRMYYRQYGSRLPASHREKAVIVSSICEYIREHYREYFSADDLARHFTVSKTSLYALFRNVLGITVNEYITNCRINIAKDLLINSTYSVEIISDMVGYSSISSFSRLFKTQTGMSPLKYRKKHAS